MSREQISEHAGYLGDQVKLKAYRAALAEVVRPGMSVLDLGAGTGVLGMLAAEAGARVVYAVDSGGILGVASEAARASGFGDRIVGIRELSTRTVLPEPVDVAVCDQIGGLAYDAGVLDYFRDARRRLLAPNGQLVPSTFQLHVAPVETEYWRQNVHVWDTRPAGFDFTAMAERAANTEFRVELGPSDYLADPVPWAEIAADCTDPVSGVVESRVERRGRLHGIAGMFEARLSPSVSLSNCPLWPTAFRRWQTFYPLRAAMDVEPGDVVVIDLDLRPRSYIASWRVTVRPASGAPAIHTRRASTALGWLMTPEDLAVERGDLVPRPATGVDADRAILEAIDGSRTLGQIVDMVWSGYPEVFNDRDDAKRRVNGLLGRHLRRQRRCGS